MTAPLRKWITGNIIAYHTQYTDCTNQLVNHNSTMNTRNITNTKYLLNTMCIAQANMSSFCLVNEIDKYIVVLDMRNSKGKYPVSHPRKF